MLKGHISKNNLQIHCNFQSSNNIAHRNRKKKSQIHIKPHKSSSSQSNSESKEQCQKPTIPLCHKTVVTNQRDTGTNVTEESGTHVGPINKLTQLQPSCSGQRGQKSELDKDLATNESRKPGFPLIGVN